MIKSKDNPGLPILVVLVWFWCISGSLARTVEFECQASGWMTLNADRFSESRNGFRCIPDLSLNAGLSKKWSIAAEGSANSYWSGKIDKWKNFMTDKKIKPYRFWLRLATNQFEARFGLQKIDFGSATLIRPLMWFDRIDPRDPLQLTDGVYGLLIRYTLLNNANFWLWGLVGNDDTKGWEFIPSTKKDIEFGGRVQMPVFKGELAVSAHHRTIDLKKGLLGLIPMGKNSAPEDRFAVDGKWDLGVGVWVEASLIHQDIGIEILEYQRLTTFGLDYTFGLGNGLYSLIEHFQMSTSSKALSSGNETSLSAVSLNYPLGLLDNLTAMFYHDWKNDEWYRFVNLQRKYDRWSFYLIGFWNPERFQLYPQIQQENPFSGKGIQVMAVFNH